MVLEHSEFTRLMERFASELPSLLASHPQTRQLAPRVQGLISLTEARFTLAIVGQMRAGKSSLLNALIGAELAPVGVTETTATVNWFSYGTGDTVSKFRVHWKGRPPEEFPIGDKDRWIGESELAQETRRIEFFADTEFLKTADVVDTPGTRSLLAEHQRTVEEYLAARVDVETRQHGAGADAILYVVPPVARQSDAELLMDFQQSTRLPGSPPHNSLAVIHKWETLESNDPYQEARCKAERLYRAIQDCVSGVMPVSAPLGRAAENFPDNFWQTIMNLACNTRPKDLEELLADEREFRELDLKGVPLSPPERERLRNEYPLPWPCLKFVLQTALTATPGNVSRLREIVRERSGLQELRRTIQERFFGKARILKSSKVLATAWDVCMQAQLLLRNHKVHLGEQLNRWEGSRSLVSERIQRGDHELRDVLDLLQYSRSEIETETEASARTLRSIGNLASEVKDSHVDLENDVTLLEALKHADLKLPPEMCQILQCLFGAHGMDVSSRLSFYHGKLAVQRRDLEQTIGQLRNLFCRLSGIERRLIEHAVERLEQVINWMEEKQIPMISLPALVHAKPNLSH